VKLRIIVIAGLDPAIHPFKESLFKTIANAIIGERDADLRTVMPAHNVETIQ
jgi:hypothetical protein